MSATPNISSGSDFGGNVTMDWQPSYQQGETVHQWKPSLLLGSLFCLVAYLAWEQISFQLSRRKPDGKQLPGPTFPVPLVGAVVEMVLDPFKFWEQQRKLSFPGLSCNTLLGKFMVFITDPDSCRTALSVNSPDSLLMAVHPSGKAILGANNLAFKHGPPHKAIRKSFLALFTRKALGTYLELQDTIIRRHLAEWGQSKDEREIRPLVRDLNAATSQEVFAGPYLGDAAQRARFSACFQDMTQGFLAFPLCFPGTTVWRARQGRLWILRVLRQGAAAAKAAVKAGKEPQCLMDFWAQRCMEEMAESEREGQPPPEHCSDAHMADTVMDFLFASQDASTASLVWMMCLMAQHPDILAKVQEEQLRIRGSPDAPVTGENVGLMTYTRQVVKEVLRYRPPAPMVPQLCQRAFKVSDTYTAPKGSLLMPSIIAANMQGWTHPDKFDPDRFSAERAEDQKCAKNFLTFGYGPHYCVGKEYAINHLTAFLAILATNCEWEHRATELSKDDSKHWLYLPTIYPADSLITFRLKAH